MLLPLFYSYACERVRLYSSFRLIVISVFGGFYCSGCFHLPFMVTHKYFNLLCTFSVVVGMLFAWLLHQLRLLCMYMFSWVRLCMPLKWSAYTFDHSRFLLFFSSERLGFDVDDFVSTIENFISFIWLFSVCFAKCNICGRACTHSLCSAPTFRRIHHSSHFLSKNLKSPLSTTSIFATTLVILFFYFRLFRFARPRFFVCD